MKELIDTAQTRELQFQGQIANAEEELKRYENKTEQFKLNITGRLDAKIDKNNQTIETLDASRADLQSESGSFHEQLDKYDENIKKFQAQLDSFADMPKLAGGVKKTIKNLEAARMRILEQKNKIDGQIGELTEKIKDLENKKQDWIDKKNEIIPSAKEDSPGKGKEAKTTPAVVDG